MRRVKTNYASLTQAELGLFLTEMLLSMTGNGNFPNPTIPLNVIEDKQTDWTKALNHSKLGDHGSTTLANEIQEELVRMVKTNGDYINNTADGDVAMLESSGYTLAKERIKKNKSMIRIVQGDHSGAGNVVIKAFPGAAAYLVEIAPDSVPEPDNDSVWKRLPLCVRCTLPFSDLEPGRLYWVRFCYVTKKGEVPYCQPVSFRVL
jgi:hypothetical protein